MRVQEAVVACGTMCGGGQWLEEAGWGFKMLGILGVGDCVSLLGGGATAVTLHTVQN